MGSAIPGNATGVCLNHCNQSAIEDTHFQGSLVAIQGQSETDSYANGIKIDRLLVQLQRHAHHERRPGLVDRGQRFRALL